MGRFVRLSGGSVRHKGRFRGHPRRLAPSRHPAAASRAAGARGAHLRRAGLDDRERCERSEEHTSELQSLMRISYAVFCLKKKKEHKYTVITASLIILIIRDNHKLS